MSRSLSLLRSARAVALLALSALLACSDPDGGSGDAGGGRADAGAQSDAAPNDAGIAAEDAETLDAEPTRDAIVAADVPAAPDAATPDAGDAGPSCLEAGHAAGTRYAIDICNLCTCGADGRPTDCSQRTCTPSQSTCTLDGVDRPYAIPFPLGDGCNTCVCAASGLACTRRTCAGAREEGAILLDDLDAPCGDRAGFTPRAVLAELPRRTIRGVFRYERARRFYPETLPDTEAEITMAFREGGFAACRIEAPGRAALDLEIVLEWRTLDGAFDEGLHTYLRKNDFGFVDAWYSVGSLPPSALNGTYQPRCLDPGDLAFSTQVDRSGETSATVTKTCERDIALVVGTTTIAP